MARSTLRPEIPEIVWSDQRRAVLHWSGIPMVRQTVRQFTAESIDMGNSICLATMYYEPIQRVYVNKSALPHPMRKTETDEE